MTTFISWSIVFCVVMAVLGILWMGLPMWAIEWVWPEAYAATQQQMAAGGVHPEVLGLLATMFATFCAGWLLAFREAMNWWHESKAEKL